MKSHKLKWNQNISEELTVDNRQYINYSDHNFIDIIQQRLIFRNGNHSSLSWPNDRESADIIYHMWRISLLCGSSKITDVRKWVTHRIFNTK